MKRGDKVEHKDGAVYLVARATDDNEMHALINTDTGNMYGNVVKVRNYEDITKEEFSKMTTGLLDYFTDLEGNPLRWGIKIGKYDVEINKHHIKVGCQIVIRKEIEKILEAMDGAN